MKLSVELSELDKVEVAYKDMIFYVKPLTVDELSFITADFKDKRGREEIPEELRGKYALDVLEKTLIGWKGIQDAKGRDIPFKKEYVRPVLTVLMKEEDLIPKLIEASMKLVTVVEEEGKKIDRAS